MKYLIVLVALVSTAAMAQEPETLHREDWQEIILYLLALFGTGGLASAAIPAKVRTAVPLVKMVLNFVGANFWNAKNKED